jgi:predicted TIM-barrel fold metal-dependent hydrolase
MWAGAGIPDFIRAYSSGRGEGSSVESGAERLLTSMDRSGIDKAVTVALVHSPNLDDAAVAAINDYVTEQVALAPDRLIRFCAVNPRSAQATEILRSEVEDRGARGLKIHGAMQQIDVDDHLLWPVYEVMEAYRLPILFHSGDIGVLPCTDTHTRASRFDEIACAFPELPMILGHAGRIDFSTVAGLLRKHPNVYVDVSSVIGRDPASRTWPLKNLLEVVKSWAGTTEHLLFGSDFPLYSISETISVVDQLASEIAAGAFGPTPLASRDVIAVRDENARKFLAKYCLV